MVTHHLRIFWKDAYSFPDYDKAEIAEHEEWQLINRPLIETLIASVDEAIEKQLVEEKKSLAVAANTASKSSYYNTSLKRQDPPKFFGDYMEFKRKWSSQVTSHKPPAEY